MINQQTQARFYTQAELANEVPRVRELHQKIRACLNEYEEELSALRKLHLHLEAKIVEINSENGYVSSVYGEFEQAKEFLNSTEQQYAIGFTSALGERETNEDCLYIASDRFFCAVFDGHCGDEAAHVAVTYVNVLLAKKCDNVIKSLKLNALELDALICAENGEAGSTFGFIGEFDGALYMGNVGDVRVVGPNMCTIDHKPLAEEERLAHYGSEVLRNRVNAVLATSRAFGDEPMKTQGIVAQLDVEMSKQMEPWLIIASDGLWDVISTDLARALIEVVLRGEAVDPNEMKLVPTDEMNRDPPKMQQENLKKAFLCYFEAALQAGDAFIEKVRGMRVYPLTEERLELPSNNDSFETRVAKALVAMAFRLGSEDNITCIFARYDRPDV